jgi:hypothetical protein
MSNVLTAARLREVLSYDPETGIWTWLKPKAQQVKPGSVAGTMHRTGYRLITIDYKQYRSSRLAHFYMLGEWPCGEMDHKDHNRSNDR